MCRAVRIADEKFCTEDETRLESIRDVCTFLGCPPAELFDELDPFDAAHVEHLLDYCLCSNDPQEAFEARGWTYDGLTDPFDDIATPPPCVPIEENPK